jgi:hypothetical protein
MQPIAQKGERNLPFTVRGLNIAMLFLYFGA